MDFNGSVNYSLANRATANLNELCKIRVQLSAFRRCEFV